jgi:hypothetical protein
VRAEGKSAFTAGKSVPLPNIRPKKGQWMAQKKTYADNDFKGTGVLKCLVCGEPYVKHKQIKLCDKYRKPPERQHADRKGSSQKVP